MLFDLYKKLVYSKKLISICKISVESKYQYLHFATFLLSVRIIYTVVKTITYMINFSYVYKVIRYFQYLEMLAQLCLTKIFIEIKFLIVMKCMACNEYKILIFLKE